MKKIFILCACFCLLATSVLAQQETHDGFLLRLAPGLGQMKTTTDNITWDGTHGFFSLMLGGAVSENTILHVEFASAALTDPSESYNGVKGTLDGDLSTSLSGIGLTQYFMPENAYVSVTVGSAMTTIESHGTYESGNGLGVNLTVGKEWWVSNEWGLGVAGHLLYANCGGGDISPDDIKTRAIGVLFSATYN